MGISSPDAFGHTQLEMYRSTFYNGCGGLAELLRCFAVIIKACSKAASTWNLLEMGTKLPWLGSLREQKMMLDTSLLCMLSFQPAGPIA